MREHRRMRSCLVAITGRSGDGDVVRRAGDLARDGGARLTILGLLGRQPRWLATTPEGAIEWRHLPQHVDHRLREIAATLPADVGVAWSTVEGPMHRALARAWSEGGHDALILSARLARSHAIRRALRSLDVVPRVLPISPSPAGVASGTGRPIRKPEAVVNPVNSLV
jgi:hypothetical protein